MSGVTLTSTATVVTLEIVERIDETMANTVNVYTFGDGSEALLDEGRNAHSITITGVENESVIEEYGNMFSLTFPILWKPSITRDANYRMEQINTMMDSQIEVAVTGLTDSYYNTDYRIIDFSMEQGPGEGACPLYHYSITLERVRDRLS